MAGLMLLWPWDFRSASQHLQQALALHPGDARVLWIAGELKRIFGRMDEAIELQRQSIAIDPLRPDPYYRIGRTLYEAHRLDEAADSFAMALSLGPGWVSVHYRLGRVRLAQGDAPAALVEMEQEAYVYYRLTGMAIVQHALGDAGASDAALQELIEKWATAGAYQIAEIYAFRGEIDHAFDWLENAYDNRDTGLNGMLVNPLFVNLHDDPRWEPLLDKMGLPH